MNKQLKVLFLPTSCAGVVFQRMLQFFRYMQKDSSMSPAMDKFDPNRATPYEWQFKSNASVSFLVELDKLIDQADMVVVGYIISDYGVGVLQAIKYRFPNKPLLVEIDDYCNEVNHYSPAAHSFRPMSEASNAVLEQLCLSDHIVTSTPYLKKLYLEYNKNIKVIPNGIDFELWDGLKFPKRKSKEVRIGWSGASTHNEDIRYILPVIDKILEKYPNVVFDFFGGTPDFILNKHFAYKKENKEPRIKCFNGWFNCYKYPQKLVSRGFDIGIAPLLDNNFNRGKSNLRWLEYSAMKIPTVASNVEPFSKSIIHGQTGYLCREIDEWVDCLSLLIEDKLLRDKIGINANQEVRKNFNVELISKDYSEFLKGVYNERQQSQKQIPAIQS